MVILDSFPFQSGDLDLQPLDQFGTVLTHQRTQASEVLQRVASADVVLTNKVVLDAGILRQCGKLKLICLLATGTNNIDLAEASRLGITVCNVPDYSSPSVAQTAIALLLELTQGVGRHDRLIRMGEWNKAGAFSFWDGPLVELQGKTMLVAGLGKIGTRVARIAEAMGMQVIGLHDQQRTGAGPWKRLELREAFQMADVVSLHCPLTEQNRGFINDTSLKWMKPSVLIINTSRGALVDEAAMARALHDQRIAGYATDVLSVEPPAADNPLLHAPHCILSPHYAWGTVESRRRLLDITLQNLQGFVQGRIVNRVN